MKILSNFKPRWYQADALRALEAGVRLVVLCWARRGGKDKTCFSYAVKKMIEQPMNVVLVFPTKEQGKKAFWNNIENDGFKTLDAIPKELRVSTRDDEMLVKLINGSTFQILGAKDPDALRGANGKLYIFSEFVDIDSAAYEVVVPIVEVNGGQIIVQSTPKIDGISGGTFKSMFDSAMKDPEEFASLITAHEYLSQKSLDRLRQKNIEKYGNDFFFMQEFMCDWGQASATSYYGQGLKAMEDDGRIGLHPYNPQYPVYTAWDLGRTAIVFFQYYKNDVGIPTVRFIDYYETNVIGNKPIATFVLSKPYVYGWHFFPHDGAVTEQSTAVTRLEKFREFGLVNSSLLVREPVEEGIKRVVEGLDDTVMHKPMLQGLIEKLYLYKRKYNPLTGNYEGPEAKSKAHGADSTRYVFTAIEQEFDKETCEHFYSQAQQDSYESEDVQTNLYSPSPSWSS
jgi:phage terminase large subunit